MKRTCKTVAAGTALVLTFAVAASAKPTRYEACTTGISAEGVIGGLRVYGTGTEPLGHTEDLVIAASGEVLALRAEVGELWGVGETNISIPWAGVDVGETWVRTRLLDEEIDDYTPLVDEHLVERVVGDGPAGTRAPDAFRASELLGDFVRTTESTSILTNFGVVDDLLIDKDRIAAVVVAPDAGLGLAETYAIPFDDYIEGDWSPASTALDLNYSKDEVEQIGAFDC